MSRARLLVAIAALLVTTSACGPSIDLEGFVKRERVDIVLGERERQDNVSRPPGANPVHSGFPSFVSPPPPRIVTVTPPPRPTTPTTVPAYCAARAPGVAAEVAGPSIDNLPAEGVYVYRREGSAKVEGATTDMTGAVTRRIADAHEVQNSDGSTVRRFSVKQVEGGLQQPDQTSAATTTFYEVDPNSRTRPGGVGVGGLGTRDVDIDDEEPFAGVKIRAVMTESPEGTDAFHPATPIRIATLPLVPEAEYWGDEPHETSEQGTDPLTGARMTVQHRTVARETVDVCGTLHQAWRVAVQGQFSTFEGDAVFFKSTLDIASQLGGLILRDELVLSDATPSDTNGDGEWELNDHIDLYMKTVSTITDVKPKPEASP